MTPLSRLSSWSKNTSQLLRRTPPLVFAMAVLSGGLIGALLGASTVLVKGVRTVENSITVTGSSTERIESDRATWLVKVESTGATQENSYSKHQEAIQKTLKFLEANGIKQGFGKMQSMVLGPANASKKEVRNPETGELVSTTWTTYQWFRIASTDVKNIFKAHQKIGQLLSQGVLVKPNNPEYTYTKLAEKRVDMLAKATADARLRAKAIARQAGSNVGAVKRVDTGVFQITVPNSTRVSSYGSYDTRTISKDITAVMGVTFGVE